MSRPVLQPAQPPIKGYQHWGVKLLRHAREHSPPASIEGKSGWSNNFTHPICLHGMNGTNFHSPLPLQQRHIAMIKEHMAFFSYNLRPPLWKPFEQRTFLLQQITTHQCHSFCQSSKISRTAMNNPYKKLLWFWN